MYWFQPYLFDMTGKSEIEFGKHRNVSWWLTTRPGRQAVQWTRRGGFKLKITKATLPVLVMIDLACCLLNYQQVVTALQDIGL